MEKLPATGLSILTFVTVRNNKNKKELFTILPTLPEDTSNLRTFVFVVIFPNAKQKKKKNILIFHHQTDLFGCIGGQQKRNKKKKNSLRGKPKCKRGLLLRRKF